VLLADDRRSWQLCSDGRYRRTEDLNKAPGKIDAFQTLEAQATVSAAETRPPGDGHSTRASLDPRA